MGFLKLLVAVYELTTFIWVWRRTDAFLTKWAEEKRGQSMMVRWAITLSTLLTRSISAECRALRRKMLIAEAFFFAPMIILGIYVLIVGPGE